MHQMLLPGFPVGAIRVGALVSILKKDGYITYFVGSDNYFSHLEDDNESARFAIATLIANGHMRLCDVDASELGIPRRTIQHWLKRLADRGARRNSDCPQIRARREPLGDVRVEGVCDFPGAQGLQDWVGFFFSKTGPNRQPEGLRIYFMYDTTLEVYYKDKQVSQRMYGWTQGKPFAFTITQQGARMTVAVNGTVLVDYTAPETPTRGGFQVSPSKQTATCRIVLKDFVLRKPAVVP